MKLLLAVTWSLITICYATMADAMPTVRDHLQNISKPDYQASMNIWLDGAIGAFMSGNADLTITRRAPALFCLPKGQGINSADAMKLVNQGVESRRWKDWTPLSSVLLDELQRAYPCNQSKR